MNVANREYIINIMSLELSFLLLKNWKTNPNRPTTNTKNISTVKIQNSKQYRLSRGPNKQFSSERPELIIYTLGLEKNMVQPFFPKVHDLKKKKNGFVFDLCSKKEN